MVRLYFFGPLFYLCLGTSFILAQEVAQDSLKVPNQQFELRHDNDFLLTTDRYYSSGLFLTYRKKKRSRIEYKSNREESIYTDVYFLFNLCN